MTDLNELGSCAGADRRGRDALLLHPVSGHQRLQLSIQQPGAFLLHRPVFSLQTGWQEAEAHPGIDRAENSQRKGHLYHKWI